MILKVEMTISESTYNQLLSAQRDISRREVNQIKYSVHA
jgi:hypothetical protein